MGKFCQGLQWREVDVKFSVASGRTWINPVANIIPAAKALIMKKKFLSGRKALIVFPSRGTQTPMAPATKMDAMAAAWYFRAKGLL
ncbi:hypothetical protein COLO4_10211 [Corchorus olitorius]|uniref:Uncharacterized protein n=1 Tax=Corchorus olitorius TaxID=93759 RepID=A0A1R3K9I9_9ROSI|nr:hypothetical protein COLO4_10211 [Corchorus olitorius]